MNTCKLLSKSFSLKLDFWDWFNQAMAYYLQPYSDWAFWHSLDWGVVSNAPPPFLKTIEGRDMKLIPLIKRREINLLLLSYLSCDVTWCHKDAILDFHGSQLGFSDSVKMLSKLNLLLQICWITSLDNLYGPSCQCSMKQALKIEWKHELTKYDLSRAPEFGCHGNRLINYKNLTTPNCSQVNLRKSHEVGIL